MRRLFYGLVALALMAAALASCVPAATPAPAAPAPAAPSAAPAAQADVAPDLQAILSKGTIVCGTSADYAPFEYIEKDGSFAGYDMDFMREVAKRIGVKLEMKDMGFDGLVTAVQEGKIDCAIAAMGITPEREAKVDFSIPYHQPMHTFMVAKGSTIKIEKPEDAAKYRVGVQSGTTLDQYATDSLVGKGLMPADKLSRYERADQAVLDLQAGRIDVLIIDRDAAVELVKKQPVEIALTTNLHIGRGDGIALKKGSAGLKAALDKAIGEIQKDGTDKALLEKYFPDLKQE